MKITKLFLLLLFCWTVLILPTDAALNGSVRCDDNLAAQDTPTNNLQAEVDAVVPPAPSRFEATDGQLGLVAEGSFQTNKLQANIQEIIQPDIQAERLTTQLGMQAPLPGVQPDIQAETPIQEPTSIRLRLPAQRHAKSALGFGYRPNSGLVYMIDPNCDLLGKIHIGDYLLALDGRNPNEVISKHQSFGNIGTQMQCTFQTQQGIITLPCTRHPAQEFGSEWQCGWH